MSGHGRRSRTRADQEGRDLVRRVLDRAAVHGARLVLITLDPSDPSSSAVLEALRGAVGSELDAVSTRTAGSSVLVDADVREQVGPPAADAGDDLAADPATGPYVLLR